MSPIFEATETGNAYATVISVRQQRWFQVRVLDSSWRHVTIESKIWECNLNRTFDCKGSRKEEKFKIGLIPTQCPRKSTEESSFMVTLKEASGMIAMMAL